MIKSICKVVNNVKNIMVYNYAIINIITDILLTSCVVFVHISVEA